MSTQAFEAEMTFSASTTHISVQFPVQGRQLPADHGYALYSAITRQLPALHGTSWLGIELQSGIPWQQGVTVLPTRGAHLRLRLPADHFRHVLLLAGKRLDISGHIRVILKVADDLPDYSFRSLSKKRIKEIVVLSGAVVTRR